MMQLLCYGYIEHLCIVAVGESWICREEAAFREENDVDGKGVVRLRC